MAGGGGGCEKYGIGGKIGCPRSNNKDERKKAGLEGEEVPGEKAKEQTVKTVQLHTLRRKKKASSSAYRRVFKGRPRPWRSRRFAGKVLEFLSLGSDFLGGGEALLRWS